MAICIALAGNPNCGKTTLFNVLTGSNQYVGNWPGVTVEKKEGQFKDNQDVTITDLPGIYSLSPYTLEEVVARNYLIDEHPDAILNIVDGTNLERNLYLTTQLIEIGIPVVVAINMMDVVEKNGDIVNTAKLEEKLGIDVVEISALKETGIEEAVTKAIAAAGKEPQRARHMFNGSVEHALAHIEELCLHQMTDENMQRWYSIKLFERDGKAREKLGLSQEIIDHIEHDIQACESELDDDAESIIIGERYNYIESIIDECIQKANADALTISDKIDKVLTNRILGLPIFAFIMWLVYYVSITTVGGFLTDWTNDVLFGDIVPTAIEHVLVAVHCADWLQSLILDGIVSGVGAVLGFVPQILVLFLFLAFLEGCGYMSRVAFVMDRLFRKFGLSGKSFIPMLVGTGCGVPGIMASRTIENDRDRKMTVMTTTFIPCSAKLPIIALVAGAFFDNAGWVSWSAYIIGVAAIVCTGIILKKTKLFAGDPAPFVMELPAYHMPTAESVLRSTWERGWSFIKKAGTIILLSTIVLWFLMNFGWADGSFGMLEAEQLDGSILAGIGSAVAWIFTPLGWTQAGEGWKMAVAAFTGLIAKENVVATLGMLYGFGEVAENGLEVWGNLSQVLTPVASFGFLVFNLLCAPCFAAMGAIRREMNNPKWFWFAIGYQCIFAYLVTLCIYQLGTWFTTGIFGAGTVVAIIVVVVFCYLLFRKDRYATARKTQRTA